MITDARRRDIEAICILALQAMSQRIVGLGNGLYMDLQTEKIYQKKELPKTLYTADDRYRLVANETSTT